MSFQLGPLTIHAYGLIVMLGAVVGSYLSTREAKRRGQDPDYVWDMLIWLLIFGIIGARVWHIFTPPASMVAAGFTTQYYLTHPLDAIAIWKGGLGIPGAVMAGAITLYVYTRRYGLSFSMWADIAVPGLALSQVIGRWGNYVNQELYGAPTNLPWAIYIDAEQGYFHPLFLYESLWSLANVTLLLWLGRKFDKKIPNGTLALVYLIVYPLGRFLLEFLRADPSTINGINANQTLMGAVMLIAAAVLLLRLRNYTPEPEPVEDPANTLETELDHDPR
jgi:phosphatidylglycerol:prolipoprotein diacylglycerol transferase